jgi:DNA transposition AAA+ family ATPase
MTYFTWRRDNVVVEESFDFMGFNFPQQSFNLQLNLPLAVNTRGDDDGAEKDEAKDARNHHRNHMTVVFRAQLVKEATLWFIRGFRATRPIDTHDVVEFVLLGTAKLIKTCESQKVRAQQTGRNV